MLQFSSASPGLTSAIPNPEWPIRSVAMTLYYAEKSYFLQYGVYSDDEHALNAYAEPPILTDVLCSHVVRITLGSNGTTFFAQASTVSRLTVHLPTTHLVLAGFNPLTM